MQGVEVAEGQDGVQGKVEEEVEGVVEGEAGNELEDEPPAAGRVGGRAAGLGRRGRVVLCRVGMRNVRWCLLEEVLLERREGP